MATTKIWSVHGRIGDVIGYAQNPDKTANPDYTAGDLQALRDVMNYATDDFKTEKQFYVTGLNCIPEIARDQMSLTKRRFEKEKGIVAFHAYQSFAPDEVTAQQAHDIGVALAKSLWGHRHEVIVATHLNTHCFHNHFVLNSVSFVDGKKFNDCKAFYQTMRQTSDDLCREHTLSVIENPKRNRARYNTIEAEKRGEPTMYNLIRADVDLAISRCFLVTHLPTELHRMGYEVKDRVKYMAVRPQGRERFVRLKTLGDGYTAEEIERRILAQRAKGYAKRIPSPPQPIRRYRCRGNFPKQAKITGFRALYFHYVYLLRGHRKRPQKKLSFALRQELQKLNQIQKQGKLLTQYRIDTMEQLFLFSDATQAKLEALLSERASLINRLRRCADPDEIQVLKTERSVLTTQISTCRQEGKLATQIAERAEQMHQNIQEQQQKQAAHTKETQQRKEFTR